MPDLATPSAIGISISASRILAVLIDHENKIQRRLETDVRGELPIHAQAVSLISDIAGFADLPVCFAVPGMVETGTSRIVDSRIAAIAGSDLKADLIGTLPNLSIENDANALAYAEFKIGAGKGTQNLCCISLGEGVGSGLILNGEIWRGANGYAGEFGAIVVDEEGTRLEDVASIPNIVRRTRARFHQDSTSTLRKLKEDDISFHDILAAASLGDDFALLMLERTGTFVGTALATVINFLNVEKIVIAGEVTSTPSAVLDAITRRAKQCTSPRAFGATDIQLSQLDEFGPATGAALLAAESI